MRRTFAFYVVACAIAAALPVLLPKSEHPARAAGDVTFSGWPTEFEGRVLTPLPLTELEQRFGNDFPGKIGRFSDGRREIIIRWVTEATGKLHPASDCFQGIGYSVKPLPLRRDDKVHCGPALRRQKATSGCVCTSKFIVIQVKLGPMCLPGTGLH